MQWQPIETAPKDGIDWILLGYYPAHMDGKQLGGKPRIAFWNGDRWVESGGAILRVSGPFSPTHWMPLPAPPAKESRFVQVACWCERCELAANHGMATRMSLCPECGDKRCSRAEFHENQCDKAPDTQRTDPPNCDWHRDEFGNWFSGCSETMPDFTPWKGTDPNGAHCPKCGKVIATKVHDKP